MYSVKQCKKNLNLGIPRLFNILMNCGVEINNQRTQDGCITDSNFRINFELWRVRPHNLEHLNFINTVQRKLFISYEFSVILNSITSITVRYLNTTTNQFSQIKAIGKSLLSRSVQPANATSLF